MLMHFFFHVLTFKSAPYTSASCLLLMDWSSSQVYLSFSSQCRWNICPTASQLGTLLHHKDKYSLLASSDTRTSGGAVFAGDNNSLWRCSSLIIPRGTHHTVLMWGDAFLLLKHSFITWNWSSSLTPASSVKCHMGMFVPHCVISAPISAGAHNELLLLCVIFIACNGML